MSLTDLAIRNAKSREKAHKLGDGRGLYLLVEPNGSKLWRLKYRFAQKDRKLSLGAYPEVPLGLARERQLEARHLIDHGVDPLEQKKQDKRTARLANANSFEAVGREWYSTFSATWAASHSSKVLLRLENNLYPWLGSRSIGALEADEILETLRRIEVRGALETAHRCLAYCGQIFRYAIATGRARRNPAADLRGSLPPARGKHLASITNPEGIGELLRAMDGYHGSERTRCALGLAPLTFVRPGELRRAEWSEVDFSSAEWRIPSDKMKMQQDHLIPLSRQALEILRELHPLTGGGRYLFHCERTKARPMSENTVNAALRRLGYTGDEMTGHGFRAMARTVLDEVLGYRVEWIEHQLAHAVKDPNGRAYNRTMFLAGRKEMMQGWADYLERLRSKDLVVVASREAA
jgi:integrase